MPEIIMADDEIDVEYIGDPEVLDEVTTAKIALGMIPGRAAEVIRNAAYQRTARVDGVTKRIVDAKSFGTTQDYVFGPQKFIIKMKKRDYERVKSTRDGHQFRRPGDPKNRLIVPRNGDSNIRIVRSVDMNMAETKQAIKSDWR